MTVLYRAIDTYNVYSSGKRDIAIYFQECLILEETDKSYLININNQTFEQFKQGCWIGFKNEYEKHYKRNCKRVLKADGKYNKRFAYINKEWALYDLQIRRTKEIQHLNRRLDNITAGLEYIKKYDINNPKLNSTGLGFTLS